MTTAVVTERIDQLIAHMADQWPWFLRYWQTRETELLYEDVPSKSVEKFSWGLEHIGIESSSDPKTTLLNYVDDHLGRGSFFDEPVVPDIHFDGSRFTFETPSPSGDRLNDIVSGAAVLEENSKKAVVILPHWNAEAADYDKFLEAYSRAGFSTFRLSLPYHDERRPTDQPYASEMVSSNVGRTLASSRQAVAEVRALVAWCEGNGISEITLVGISIGSSIAALAAATDDRVAKLVCVHFVSDFGDTVWLGAATQHIRAAIENRVSQAELSRLWSLISPGTVIPKLAQRGIPIQIFEGRYDIVFAENLRQQTKLQVAQSLPDAQWSSWPCGHYTAALSPFAQLIFLKSVRFLRS